MLQLWFIGLSLDEKAICDIKYKIINGTRKMETREYERII